MKKITTTCVHCNTNLSLDSQYVDKSVRCPKCKEVFKVANIAFVAEGSPEVSQEALITRSQPSQSHNELGKLAVEAESESPRALDAAQSAGSNSSSSDGESESVRPSKIGRYDVTRELGRGAFGVVYAAHDPLLNRQVAIKIQSRELSEHDYAKLMSEARAAARLRHPNLVAVFEVASNEGRPFVVSELIDGQTLADRIAEGPVNPHEAATIIRDLARGLVYAHSQGLIHRDVKPHNILVGEDGRPQIADFGLAVDRRDEEQAREQAYSRSGTLAYMAPEQAGIGGASVGPAVDQYALGATLFEMLTGKRPHAGSSLEILTELEAPEPPRARGLLTSVPIDLDAICFKAMSHEPWKRYDNCNELADDLDRFLRGDLIRGRRVGLVERARHFSKRNPKIAAWATGTAIALGGLFLATTSTAVRNIILVKNLGDEKKRMETNFIDRSRQLQSEFGNSSIDNVLPQNASMDSADLPLWIAYSRKLNKAVRADALGDSELSDKLLAETRPGFRDWEFQHLAATHQGLIVKLPIPGNAQGRKLAALSDGESFVVQDLQTIRRIHIRDGSELGVWKNAPVIADEQGIIQSGGPLVCLQHSPLILCANGNQIEGWNYESDTRLPPLQMQLTFPCKELLSSPDDRWLMAVSGKGEYELWDLSNQKLHISEIARNAAEPFLGITSVVFASDSSYFQAVRSDGKQPAQLYRRDVFTLEPTWMPAVDVVELFASDQMGQSLVLAGAGSSWQLRTSGVSAALTGAFPSRPNVVKFRQRNLNEQLVVLTGQAGFPELYLNGKIEDPIYLYYGYVSSLDVSPDGRLVFAGVGTEVYVWDIQVLGNKAVSEPTSVITSMSLSSSDSEAVVCSIEGKVSLIDVSTGQKKWEKENDAQ